MLHAVRCSPCVESSMSRIVLHDVLLGCARAKELQILIDGLSEGDLLAETNENELESEVTRAR